MTEAEELAVNMARMMANINESLAPLFEAGQGVRVQLERDGWSPTMAETIAGELVQSVIYATLRRAAK